MDETPDQITMRFFKESVQHKHFKEMRVSPRVDDTLFVSYHLSGRTGEMLHFHHCISSRVPGHEAFIASLGFGLDGQPLTAPDDLLAA
jgi:hypothetical protein